jgi:hypothetical protein
MQLMAMHCVQLIVDGTGQVVDLNILLYFKLNILTNIIIPRITAKLEAMRTSRDQVCRTCKRVH